MDDPCRNPNQQEIQRVKSDCELQSKISFQTAWIYLCNKFSDYIYFYVNRIRSICFKKNILKHQMPRNFKDESNYNIKYRKGYIFSQPESDGTLGGRCIEYKSFFNCMDSSTENIINKFKYEVLRFACACLNKRQNGTCYFGVADTGEIVGLRMDGLKLKSLFTDGIKNENGIVKYFHPFVAKRAQECIKNPIFIKVINSDVNNLYVMEVDIEPLSIFCEDRYFKILNIFIKTKQKRKNDYYMFVRNGSSTKRLNDNEEQQFIKNELPQFVAYRKRFEQQELNQYLNPDAQHACVSCNSKRKTMFICLDYKSGNDILCGSRVFEVYITIMNFILTVFICFYIFIITMLLK